MKMKIDNYIFGNGQNDPSQYASSDPDAYTDNEGCGAFAIIVAEQYGTKPICTIEYDNMTILIYKLSNQYGAKAIRDDGFYSLAPHTFLNTVNPEAIVNYFRRVFDSIA